MTDMQYILNPKIVFREEEGESLLFDPETGQVKVLNETATLIYELIKQNLTREKIIESVTCEYDNMNRQELGKDIDEFISQMEQLGIIMLEG